MSKKTATVILLSLLWLIPCALCSCTEPANDENQLSDNTDVHVSKPLILELDFSSQQDVDLSVLVNYPELQRLNLNGLGLSDVSDVTACTDLQWLDLRGNALTVDAYDAIAAALPACQILWDIPIAGTSYDCSSTELTLPDVNEDELKNLTYFTDLKYVDATAVSDIKALADVRASMPQCEFDWNVTLFGQVYPSTTQQLDLRSFANSDTAELQLLAFFSGLDSVDLRGWPLDLATMNDLAESCASTSFLFSFSLAGVDTDSTATELDISGHAVTSPDDISSYLRFMPNLTYLDMCNCGLSNEEMAQLCNSFPNVKFVWMIHMSVWSLRTDAVAFSTLSDDSNPNKLKSSDLTVLKYCNDLIALDLGHHQITDLSWLSELPKLRILILARNNITDITPISQLKDLQYLELFCNYELADISPLSELEQLKDLNICYCYKINDYTPLHNLPKLERLWIIGTRCPYDIYKSIAETYPNATVYYASSGESTDGGWRRHERYRAMRNMFLNNCLDPVFADE